jgi:hypothetical protein
MKFIMSNLLYEIEDVAKHHKPDDLWLVIDDNVYNLTEVGSLQYSYAVLKYPPRQEKRLARSSRQECIASFQKYPPHTKGKTNDGTILSRTIEKGQARHEE